MSNKNLNYFICNYGDCSAQYRRKDRFEIHVRTHTGERPFICAYDSCNKSYFRAEHLKRHELMHEGPVRCTYEDCDMVFKSKANLKRHIENVHLKMKPKLYKCSQCDQEFNKHSWLKSHEYKHDNIKAYVCSYKGCEKRFTVSSKLKRHLKVHQGYKCTHSDCNAVSSTWSLHLKHLKVVHPTVYQCPVCSKLIKHARNIESHCNTHTKSSEQQNLRCPEPKCNRSYLHKKNLQHHIKTAHESRPCNCSHETCSLSFKDDVQLKRHFERAHDPDVPLSSKKRKLKAKQKKRAKLSFAALLAGLDEEPSHNQTLTVIDKNLCKPESTQTSDTSSINNIKDSIVEVKAFEAAKNSEINENICEITKDTISTVEKNSALNNPDSFSDTSPIQTQNRNNRSPNCSSKAVIECF